MNKSDPGPLPEIKWLPKDVFVVDFHYQRHTDSLRSQRVIALIADNFKWARFQTPTVMPGPKEGTYVVIDGQHRVKGAQQCPHVKKIPVYIIPKMSMEEAAEHFIAINLDRVRLHPLAIYRAKLSLKDPEAMKIHEVCEEAGVSIAKQPATRGETKPFETQSIGAIEKGIRRFGEENVIAALMIIPETFKLVTGMMRSSILLALMELFFKLGVRNVNREALRTSLKEEDPTTMEQKARKSSKANHTSVAAEMLNRLMNRYETNVKRRKSL